MSEWMAHADRLLAALVSNFFFIRLLNKLILCGLASPLQICTCWVNAYTESLVPYAISFVALWLFQVRSHPVARNFQDFSIFVAPSG